VLRGWAGDELLTTYHDERHAVGSAMAEQAIVRNRIRHGLADERVRAQMVDDIIITLGYRYRSQAVITEDDKPVLTTPLELSGEPGTRAPHVWLERGGARLSTIDLFWDSFVLLVSVEADAWQAAGELAARGQIPLRVVRIGPGGDYTAPDGDWPAAYGVSPRGAVLVRPDAFVAWRSAAAQPDPEGVLAGVLATVTGAGTRAVATGSRG
jgi:tetracenomycin A2 monooxygenase-dioxygenase